MFWNSGLVFCGFNMVKMEGNAFALTMEPALDELYDDKKAKAEAKAAAKAAKAKK